VSSFEFTDEDGDKLTARPMLGHPAILLKTSPNGAVIPPDRLEEVIAGMRDMARQTGARRACPAFVGDTDLCQRCGDARRWHRATEGTGA